MADRAAARRAERETAEFGPRPDRETWPVPPELRGNSARDCLLWYICDGWDKIFGESPEIETLVYHDFGYHELRKGSWKLTLVDLEQFPDEEVQG